LSQLHPVTATLIGSRAGDLGQSVLQGAVWAQQVWSARPSRSPKAWRCQACAPLVCPA